MSTTTISWTDKTWNVTRGCRRVSPGCEHCYAERQANRFAGKGGAYEGLIKLAGGRPRWNGETRFAVEHLADPLRWRKPCRIFVDSMSDLFYEGFSNEQIAAVFGVMAACPQHTFQILTKRARRMREWFEWLATEAGTARDAAIVHYENTSDMEVRLCVTWLDRHHVDRRHVTYPVWPLPNVWLGVSVEDQERADERIPELLRTPAAVRFLSCEPLLGPVDVAATVTRIALDRTFAHEVGMPDWIIAGCESGHGARPMDVAWARSLRDQCAAAGVAFFLKQAVEQPGAMTMVESRTQLDADYVGECPRVGPMIPTIWCGPTSHRKGGGVIELPYLDGVQHAAFPEVRP